METTSLSGEDIEVPLDFIGSVMAAMTSDTIYFNSYDKSFKYLVGTINDGRLSVFDTIMKVGQGPGEVLDATIFRGMEDNLYAIIRASNHPISIKEINLNNGLKDLDSSNLDSIKEYVSISGLKNTAVFTTDSTIMFIGGRLSEVNGMFSMLNLKNGNLERVNFFPDDGIKCIPMTKYMVYYPNGYLASNNRGQYIYELGFNKFAFIFHLNGDEVVIDNWLFDEYPKYSQSDDIGNFNYEPEVNNIELYATDAYIYVLHKNLDQNGQKSEDFEKTFNGSLVEVYDWAGDKIASYDLDTYGYRVFVDNNNTTLYLEQIGNDNKDYGLRKYTLPKL